MQPEPRGEAGLTVKGTAAEADHGCFLFQIRTFEVKPLCGHVRVHDVDRNRPFNTLAFSGWFEGRRRGIEWGRAEEDEGQTPGRRGRYFSDGQSSIPDFLTKFGRGSGSVCCMTQGGNDGGRASEQISSGAFSLAEVHAWIVQLLIGVPPKSGADDTVTFCFEGTVDGGTQLQATFS